MPTYPDRAPVPEPAATPQVPEPYRCRTAVVEATGSIVYVLRDDLDWYGEPSALVAYGPNDDAIQRQVEASQPNWKSRVGVVPLSVLDPAP